MITNRERGQPANGLIFEGAFDGSHNYNGLFVRRLSYGHA